MLERRTEAVAASEQREECSVSEKEPLRGERIDLLLEHRILVAEPIDGRARVKRPNQAASKGGNEDQCDGGRGDERKIGRAHV